jgi:tryptophan-rich sensory protein
MSTAITQQVFGHFRPKRLDVLLLFGGLSLLTLLVGGWFTMLGMGEWYDRLNTPSWQPPGWAFTAVWMLILGLLAVATWLMARDGIQRTGVGFALFLYSIQLLLNAGWSLIFFTLRSPDWALFELVVLLGVLIGMMIAYGRISEAAAWLLGPYVGWVCFAMAINIWIVINN